ncbi:hypothetical protein NMY22_g18896 [Coprinellus aureogranulatus]|nr:hypothetical protein NMY22_g18896 [Coprinellus aureogranulatus]
MLIFAFLVSSPISLPSLQDCVGTFSSLTTLRSKATALREITCDADDEDEEPGRYSGSGLGVSRFQCIPLFLAVVFSCRPSSPSASWDDLNVPNSRIPTFVGAYREVPASFFSLLTPSASLHLLRTLAFGSAFLSATDVRTITLLDSSTVSFSNPVRQPLFEFSDCLDGGKPKAETAASTLKRIYPGIKATGVNLATSYSTPYFPLSLPTHLSASPRSIVLTQVSQSFLSLFMFHSPIPTHLRFALQSNWADGYSPADLWVSSDSRNRSSLYSSNSMNVKRESTLGVMLRED